MSGGGLDYKVGGYKMHKGLVSRRTQSFLYRVEIFII